MLNNLRTQVGRLDVESEDLRDRRANSAYFKTLFAAFKAGGACDWDSKLPLSLLSQGNRHKIHEHHIFPQKVLRDAGIEDRLQNDIANLTFISAAKNRRLSATPAAEYLPTLSVDERRQHCIPEDPELWAVDNFPEFLETRRGLIVTRLNAFIAETGGE